MFNQFMEEIIWTNYGGPLVTLLGRDIVVFIVGYLTHLIVSALIECFATGLSNKKSPKDKEEDR